MSRNFTRTDVSAEARRLNPSLFGGPGASKSAVSVAQKSPLAVKFERLWEVIGGPAYEMELPVVDDRRWRFDYAWSDAWVALELQGGIYLAGRGGHVAPKRVQNDCDKFTRAVCIGWRPCKLATGQITPENLLLIKDLILQMRSAPEGWRKEQDRLFTLARQTGRAHYEQAAQHLNVVGNLSP